MMNITDTGLRGYLRWLQADQPAIYKAVAPQIAQLLPQVFSDYEQSLAQGALFGLSDDVTTTDTGTATLFSTTDAFNPSGASAQVAAPSASSSPDVASVANTGPASPDITQAIANLVGSAAQAYMSVNAQQATIDAYKQINAAQLQRAQTARSPLSVTSGSMNIPVVSGVSGQIQGS